MCQFFRARCFPKKRSGEPGESLWAGYSTLQASYIAERSHMCTYLLYKSEAHVTNDRILALEAFEATKELSYKRQRTTQGLPHSANLLR